MLEIFRIRLKSLRFEIFHTIPIRTLLPCKQFSLRNFENILILGSFITFWIPSSSIMLQGSMIEGRTGSTERRV